MSSPLLEDSPLPPAAVDAWRADRPSPGELRRGYAKYLERRSARRARRPWLWVGAGMLLGVSLAQAAVLVSPGWFGPAQPAASAKAPLARTPTPMPVAPAL